MPWWRMQARMPKKTGDFRCERCHERVHVAGGDKIPKPPNCGNDTDSKG